MTEPHSDWQQATVRAVTRVAVDTVRIELVPEQSIPVKPGAHVDVRVRIEDRWDERSYSVVDAGDAGEWIGLTVFLPECSRGGATFMHQLGVGDRVAITKPIQEFPLRIGAPAYTLVAGGVGITALAGMAALLKRLGADYRLHYVGHTRERMPYLSALETVHGERLDANITAERGRLSVAELVKETPAEAELYMCGPIRLMEELKREWQRAGRDLTALRYETFGNSGWFASEEFEVTVPKYGVTTTVRSNESMLEALERAGVEVMFDCRRGECGLCEARVVALEGRIDHRDVFYSERQKAPNNKLCCCVSRAVADAAQVTEKGISGGRARLSIELS